MSAAGHFGTALPRLREIKVGRVLIPEPGQFILRQRPTGGQRRFHGVHRAALEAQFVVRVGAGAATGIAAGVHQQLAQVHIAGLVAVAVVPGRRSALAAISLKLQQLNQPAGEERNFFLKVEQARRE